MGLPRSLLPLLALHGLGSVSAAPPDQSKLYFSDVKPCPVACDKTPNVADWTVYHDTARLSVCSQPMLLDFNLYNAIDDPDTAVSIRACTVGDADETTNYLQSINYTTPDAEDSNEPLSDKPVPVSSSVRRHQEDVDTGCGKIQEKTSTATLSWWNPDDYEIDASVGQVEDAIIAVQTLQKYLKNSPNCERKIVFSAVRGTLAGLFAGGGSDNAATAGGLVQKFADTLKANGLDARTAVEVCGKAMSSWDMTGVVADVYSDFAAVQTIVRGWNDAECASNVLGSKQWEDVAVFPMVVPQTAAIVERSSSWFSKLLSPRADCRTIKVVSGDGCDAVAARCGIGSTAFKSFNRQACSVPLTEGQAMCCSAGTLPDVKPKPGSNGACATWTMELGQYCQLVAVSNGLTVDELKSFNNKTWGWTGCDNIQSGLKICISSGDPPMPASVSNAVCGPTVPNTPFPGAGRNISELNPCPLKACCNIWGQCGTTKEFCVVSPSATGNPGTSAPGANGCVHNCGMEIINNKQDPTEWRTVGYFEGWNFDRECLNMHVGRIPDSYTHIHFSFGEISRDFNVVIPEEVKDQFDEFKKATTYKKVLAFGGWSFSTDFDTSPIFAQSVSSAITSKLRQMLAAITPRMPGG